MSQPSWSTVAVRETAVYVRRARPLRLDPSVMSHAHDMSAALPADGSFLEPDVHGVHLRPLVSLAEYHACVDVQVAVWGAEFSDIVPASVLQVATHIGGILLGALADDTLLGFVFGLTGVRDDEIVHWSHMLGVRADARGMGIGRRLKEYQRALLAQHGIAREFWTFDPLQARNAHLNINRLGVRIIDYVVDMYGSMGSPLHFGVATDRLIVECATNATPKSTPTTGAMIEQLRRAPMLTPVPRPGDVVFQGESPTAVLLEIPVDVERLTAEAPDALHQWRAATRTNFQWAFLHGYRVAALHRDRVAGRAFYVLRRDMPAAAK
jgi:predicted GNAT superfamily acetyltransferase